MNKREKLYEDIHNYTRFKLVEMLIEEHKDSKLDNLNAIEQLSDNVLDTLALCGLKFYSKGMKKK